MNVCVYVCGENWNKEAFGQTFSKETTKPGGKTSVARPAKSRGRNSKVANSGPFAEGQGPGGHRTDSYLGDFPDPVHC